MTRDWDLDDGLPPQAGTIRHPDNGMYLYSFKLPHFIPSTYHHISHIS